MVEHLGIEITALEDRSLHGRMPVDHRTKQPAGLLHGGASVALAETLGSIAASLVVDSEKFMCVGLEINANHLQSSRAGYVAGVATPIHLGKSTHVWEIRIHQEADDKQEPRLLCISRLTMAVLAKSRPAN